MNKTSLHWHREALTERLTVGSLRRFVQPGLPVWISLEPRAWLPKRDGRHLTGLLPGLKPLARCLPEGLDDLPLLTASLYEARQWRHFHDANPLSGLAGHCITWQLDPAAGASTLGDLNVQTQQVLTWQDRQRFGLSPDSALPAALHVEHFYQKGKRLAWRLIPNNPAAEARA